MFAAIVGAMLALAGMAGAQEIVLDDFGDGDDEGWIHDSSGGIFEVVGGGYRIATASAVPTGSNGGYVSARLAGTDDPEFSNGYFRARIRANTAGTSMNMLLRAPGNLTEAIGGYNFYASTALGEFGIERLGFGVYRLLGILSGERFREGEDWMLEA